MEIIIEKKYVICYNFLSNGDVMVSTLHQKNKLQVVDFRWPLKKEEIKIKC